MKKYKINQILTLFAMVLLLVPVASAITYPTLNGYVTDNANIIDVDYKQKITDLADKINKETTVEIAVLTIQSLEGDDPETYAVQTFRQNGVGKKDNNNGLLILVAKDDRKYRFEVGYGLEGTIPDAMKVPIGDNIITPNFKNGDYGKGIYESMLVLKGLIRGTIKPAFLTKSLFIGNPFFITKETIQKIESDKLNEIRGLNVNEYLAYEISGTKGYTINANIDVVRGDMIDIFLVNSDKFKDYQSTMFSSEEFNDYYSAGSGIGLKSKTYSFELPETANYYIIIDNTAQVGNQPSGNMDVKIKLEKNAPIPNISGFKIIYGIIMIAIIYFKKKKNSLQSFNTII